METDGIVSRLVAARALDSVDAVRSFDAALGALPDVLDETTIGDLLLVLDDETLMPEVMFELVHRIERTALGQEEAAVLRVLARLTASAPRWAVGERTAESAIPFIADLASRVTHRLQITTDGFGPYLPAIEAAFGIDVDYAMLIKEYGQDPSEERRFSPPVVLSEQVRIIKGDPDPSKISTSYVERQNLTMRMGMRRFTRLTNGFSKKLTNHAAAVSLPFFYMNWGRPHKTLANPYPRTPAMAAGLSDHIWTCEEIAALLD